MIRVYLFVGDNIYIYIYKCASLSLSFSLSLSLSDDIYLNHLHLKLYQTWSFRGDATNGINVLDAKRVTLKIEITFHLFFISALINTPSVSILLRHTS